MTTPTTTCPVWPGLCDDADPLHRDHANHQLSGQKMGWPVSVGFVELSDRKPLLYIDAGLASDFDPKDAPKVAAQLRAAAEAIEKMQHRVTEVQAARG
ncbi:hypothetical protein [Streptomyces rochei]|uniref:hypothetical protein n=1 Tax=Streptomyces rochei TaxID=1928 RepID=UPI00373E03D4